ncbi:hypothetical protein J1792_00030 [Streptomyces triculaminicus]|uniref:Uncharacterized protein n=2 Tax=Streptomyces TaxID=1883 RepID=A0A939FFY4_9ACTN|nr:MULTISPECIES: hypothetical protein [Streptomyces]MBO0651256.1 hypothetical protein [Streptomyces triculaminicus]QSY49590.1 hypothetical protein J3S04_00030 [Streptomyces griseocarneus]
MTSRGRQHWDGSAKRVQLTSGDHSGPKDKKKPKVNRKGKGLSAEEKRAAELREVERFRQSIRASELRRKAREEVPKW